MKNGYYHETGGFAPETAIGTGAAEPLFDEVELAKQVPSVDESTAGTPANQPSGTKTIDYSGETVADDASDDTSTGEDFETRTNENAHAEDENVNAPADEVRPAEPQAPAKRSRKASASS